MLSLPQRTPFFFLLAGLVAALLSACSVSKQRVDPYPERLEPPATASENQPRVVMAGPGDRRSQGRITAPGPAGQQPGTAQPPSADELLPVLTQVDDRIVAYEEKLRAWEGFRAEAEKHTLTPELDGKIASCQDRLQGIMSGYNQLHELLIKTGPGQRPAAGTMEQLRGVSREDIIFLESECQLLIAGGQPAGDQLAGSTINELGEGEKAIATAMTAGDYPRVILLYEQLPAAAEQKPSFESVYSYGQALLRTGREQDAGRVFSNLLQDVQRQNQVGREFKLMQLVADIQFGLEEYSNAFAGYVNIINRYAGLGENIEWARKQQAVISVREQQGPEVKEFAAIMRAYLSHNQPRDGFRIVLLAEQFLSRFPESTVTPTVNRILFEARDSAEAWYAGNLMQISQLKDEKKYAEALQALQRLPLQDIPVDRKAQLQSLIDEMTTVQVQEAAARNVVEEAALQEAWTSGQNHLQMKEYDQAIAVFSGMLNTSYADRAQREINAAANLAAQEDRRQAAEFFVQSSSAKDQATRVSLLRQSRQLLQNILNKYPQTNLVEKVRKNLEKIEQDLRAIDPSLLDQPTTVSGLSAEEPGMPSVTDIPRGNGEKK